MEITLDKIDKNCSNAYLIDERLCLADSLNILNYNFNSLSGAIDQLNSYANYMNNLYNLFTASSGNWNTGAVNTNENSASYDSMYVNLTQLSATYNKEFAVFYPYMIEINDWYSNLIDYQDDIKDWLNLNFSPNDFAENQYINVYVNLYQIDTFNFSFAGQYHERCILASPSVQVCCSGHWCQALNRGCNYKVGRRKRCGNAYDACGQSINDSCGNGGCPSYNAKMLTLYDVSVAYNDNFTARSLYLRFKKIGNSTLTWTKI